MKISGKNISMIRGDSETIKVSCKDTAGLSIPLVVGDKIYLTVKASTSVDAKTLQKVVTDFIDGVAYIEITPSDTRAIRYGSYMYDIQLTRADGCVTTIITPNKFTIEGEVTYE